MNGMRWVLALLIGIVILATIHYVIDVKTQAAPRALRASVLVPHAETADSIVLEHAGSTRIRMLLQDGGWKIVEPCQSRVDRESLLRLTDAMMYTPISEAMTDAELLRLGRTRVDFGLVSPRLKATFGSPGGVSTTVSFGAFTPSGDGVYATVNAANSVYVVPTNVWFSVNGDLSYFRYRRVYDLVPADAMSFDVKNAAGRFVRIARNGSSWQMLEPQSSAVSLARVGEFLDTLSSLEVKEFVCCASVTNKESSVLSASLLAGYGLDSDAAITVSIECLGDGVRTTSFGREDGKGMRYALVDGGQAVVKVKDVLSRPFAEGIAYFVDSRVFPVEAEQVTSLSLDDAGETYLLARNADGLWQLDSPVSASADQRVVAALLGRVLSIRQCDLRSEGLRVHIGTNGTPACVARESFLQDFRIDDLRSKTLLRMDAKTVRRVVIADRGGKTIPIARGAEGASWTLENADGLLQVDTHAIEKLVETLSSLDALRIDRLKNSAGDLATLGLDVPFRTIAIDRTNKDAVRCNILIGDVTDGGRFVMLGGSDTVFVVATDVVDRLLVPVVH